MKKTVSMLIALIMLISVIPVQADSLPYVVISEFNDGELIGVVVKANENFTTDFKLIAALCKDDTVLSVKSMEKSKLSTGREISFDYVEGAEVKLYAWDSYSSLLPAKEDYLAGLNYNEVMSQLKGVNDYWITKNSILRGTSNPWQVGVYHTGNMQAYYMTGDEAYRNYSYLWSDVNDWQYYTSWGDNVNADNMCCYQTYIDLYNIDKDESYLKYVEESIDKMMRSTSLSYWDWIDAFYMAAPVFTKMYELTGDEKYLDKMYNMIKYTAETLNCYDEEVGLWFRDASFINIISPNGKHVYWSRGNGWVYAAFARIIEELPDSYEHKDYFVNIFCEMSQALIKAQCQDGAWHESLLDPLFNPDCEESGTGFFVYGLMWGINNGYLDEKEYLQPALFGWRWLTTVALQDNYSIGYVQHIGAQPTDTPLTAQMTEHYAYANFVFAASEVAKYLGGVKGDILPYLNKKLLGNIEVYKMDSPYYIKNGEIHEFTHPMVIEEDGDIKILQDYMYILIEDYLSEGMFIYEKDGVYVISEFITPFNKTEGNLITMLSEILDTGKFPEREHSDPDRLNVEAIYSLPDSGNVENLLIVPGANITSSHWSSNGPWLTVDRDLSTYYYSSMMNELRPPYIEFALNDEFTLNKIGIAFKDGNTIRSKFSVSVSTDGNTYTEIVPLTESGGTTVNIEYYNFSPVKASYVRLYGYGNTVNNNFCPTEVELYSSEGSAVIDDNEIEISLEGLSASLVVEPHNGVEKAFDDNYNTYLALQSEDVNNPEYLQVDLGEAMSINQIALAFRYGDQRQYLFKISISSDGETFTDAVAKTYSRGNSADLEYYPLDGAKARYIRLYGYGWAQTSNIRNVWFSLCEMNVYGDLEK